MSASIKEIGEKIKHFYTHLPIEALFSLAIILVGFAAFGLGRLSALDEAREQVTLMYNNQLAAIPSALGSGSVVVSKNGTKYHYPWCGGALRIKETNKRWYDSVADARAAGYTPAGNCGGLE